MGFDDLYQASHKIWLVFEMVKTLFITPLNSTFGKVLDVIYRAMSH